MIWQQHHKDQVAQSPQPMYGFILHSKSSNAWGEVACFLFTLQVGMQRRKKLTHKAKTTGRKQNEFNWVMEFIFHSRRNIKKKGEIPTHRWSFEWCLISNHFKLIFLTPWILQQGKIGNFCKFSIKFMWAGKTLAFMQHPYVEKKRTNIECLNTGKCSTFPGL